MGCNGRRRSPWSGPFAQHPCNIFETDLHLLQCHRQYRHRRRLRLPSGDLAVAGFGAGALVFTPVILSFITSVGISMTLTYMGTIFAIDVVIGRLRIYTRLGKQARIDISSSTKPPPLNYTDTFAPAANSLTASRF